MNRIQDDVTSDKDYKLAISGNIKIILNVKVLIFKLFTYNGKK